MLLRAMFSRSAIFKSGDCTSESVIECKITIGGNICNGGIVFQYDMLLCVLDIGGPILMEGSVI